jgi:hypothetical protein
MIDKSEATLKAIDVMTALTTQQDSTDFVTERVLEYLGGPDQGIELVVGLVNLSQLLLLLAAKAEGESGNATPDEQRAVLQYIAQKALKRGGGSSA